MEEVVYYTVLFDLYGKLLTEQQQRYFQDYYFLNLSLAEIAQQANVSRNAVHKQIKMAVSKLEHYEAILHVARKSKKLEQLLQQIDNDVIKEKIQKILDEEIGEE